MYLKYDSPSKFFHRKNVVNTFFDYADSKVSNFEIFGRGEEFIPKKLKKKAKIRLKKLAFWCLATYFLQYHMEKFGIRKLSVTGPIGEQWVYRFNKQTKYHSLTNTFGPDIPCKLVIGKFIKQLFKQHYDNQ